MNLSCWLVLLSVAFSLRHVCAAPANDNFANAETLTGSSVVRTISTAGATAEFNEPAHSSIEPSATVWYRWTAPGPGFATITTAGSSYDTVLAVYRGTSLANLNEVASNDDFGGVGTISKVNFVANGNVVYYIAVDGFFGEVGTLKFTIALQTGIQTPPNDNFANAIRLTNTPVSVITSNLLATLEPGELTPVTYGGASVWWTWEPRTNGYYRISTVGSDFDTILSIYKSGTLVSWDDDSARPASSLRINARAGTRYHLSVQGYEEAMGKIQLNIAADPPKVAKPWALFEMNGGVVRSTDFKGKVVILDFWATWCGPCLEEIPTFIALQDKYGADGLVVIGVSTDAEGFAVVAPFAAANNVNYIQTIWSSEIVRDYGPIESIPRTFIISRDGLLMEMFVGTTSQETFENTLRPLLYPELSIAFAREGSNLVLRWPAISGYVVQAATSLVPGNWTELSLEISVSGDSNVAQIPISAGLRYFRLLHP